MGAVRIGRTAAIGVVCVLLCGCGAVVKYAPFNEQAYQPTESVEFFSGPAAVERPYKEIGLITVSDNGWNKSEADLIAKLRKKAMKVGADGVFLQPSEQRSQGVVPIGGVLYQPNERIVRGIAIKYTD